MYRGKHYCSEAFVAKFRHHFITCHPELLQHPAVQAETLLNDSEAQTTMEDFVAFVLSLEDRDEPFVDVEGMVEVARP